MNSSQLHWISEIEFFEVPLRGEAAPRPLKAKGEDAENRKVARDMSDPKKRYGEPRRGEQKSKTNP